MRKALPYALLVIVVLGVCAFNCDIDDPDGGRIDCQTGLAECRTSTPWPTHTPDPKNTGKEPIDWGSW